MILLTSFSGLALLSDDVCDAAIFGAGAELASDSDTKRCLTNEACLVTYNYSRTITCQRCRMLHVTCNICHLIYTNGGGLDSGVDIQNLGQSSINVYLLQGYIYCQEGCHGTIMVFKGNTIVCTASTVTIVTYKVKAIAISFGCVAVIYAHVDTEIELPRTSIVEIHLHRTFEEFCINTGLKLKERQLTTASGRKSSTGNGFIL